MRMNCCKTFAAASTLLLSVGIAGAAEVTLISVGGVKGALDKIVAHYTKETGNHVMYTVGSPGTTINSRRPMKVIWVIE